MYYIGIDLGGTNIAAGIVDESYQLQKKMSVPTQAKRPADAIVDSMAQLCNDLLRSADLTYDDIHYIGIATPGAADHDHGIVIYANNLPFLNYPLAEELGKRIGFHHVWIENDANAAAKAEATVGAARGSKSSVMITLGTGVGGGIIDEGRVYSGFNYAGAELGHMIIQRNGEPCTCGLRGCWETYSSATGLIRMTRKKMEQTKDTIMWDAVGGNLAKVNGRTAFNAMYKGDAAAKEVIEEYVDYLCVGLINIINIFSPEVLSIGGGISGEGQKLIDMIEDRIMHQIYSRNCPVKTKLCIAQLGNDAGIVGAALLHV